MPFVTTSGSERLNHDVIKDKYDRDGVFLAGNGLVPLIITAVDEFDFDSNSPSFKEIVWRGQPNREKLCWNEEMPVFRCLTNRFKTGHEWIEDRIEREKTDWGRFIRDREQDILKKGSSTYTYEPHLDDVKVSENNFHFPLWVLEWLEERDFFVQATKVAKVMLPDRPMLTKEEFETIMKEIKARKENDNISGTLKQSKAKAG
jgi:hypothetical protein